MISEIGELLEDAQRSGLATSELELCAQSHLFETSLLSWLEQHNYQPLKNRSNEGPISELIPQTREIANPLSLSATTGLDQQPMHTDGAHLRTTPDFVLLWSETTNKTPTRVWQLPQIPRTAQNGIFVVFNGKERWLTQAYDSGTIRFDPGCMSPADQSARNLSHILTTPPEQEIKLIHWDVRGKLAVIDNKRILHGRSRLSDGDNMRCLKRLAVKRK